MAPTSATARGVRWCRAVRRTFPLPASRWCPVWLLLFVLLAGCASSAPAQPASTPTPRVLTLPAALTGYRIFVTDLSSGNLAELGTRTLHVSRSVHGLGTSADGHTLYVTDVSGSRLVAYDLRNGALTLTHSAPVGATPVHMVETLDGRLIFVANFGGKSVTVIDTTTWAPRATIRVPDGPHAIVLAPDGLHAFVACYGSSAIAVLDIQHLALATTIVLPPGSEPYGLAMSADGRDLYASDNLTGRLFVADVATQQLVRSVQVGSRPALVTRSPDGATLYVADGGSHAVTVLGIGADPANPVVRATVPLEGYPHGLAVTPDGRFLVVANTISRTLSVVDTASLHVSATISGETFPNDVLITR